MNTLDLILGGILLIAFFLGFQKGFVRAVMSLVGLVLAVFIAVNFSQHLNFIFERWFHLVLDLNRIIAFAITFTVVLVIFSLIGRIVTQALNLIMMGMLNKLLGGLFNMLSIAFLLSALFMIINASEDYKVFSEEQRADSTLYKPIAAIAPAVLPSVVGKLYEIDFEPDTIIRPESPEQTRDSLFSSPI